MPQVNVADLLHQLRKAADAVRNGFPDVTWRRVAGPGPATLTMNGSGAFSGLVVVPGQDLVLQADLKVPDHAAGVRLTGDCLEGTLGTLYPADIDLNGKRIFHVEGVPVAAGPCLFTLIPALAKGSNGRLRFTLHLPKCQAMAWVGLKLTTPGLRMRFEKLDTAWAELKLASTVATTNDERAAVAAGAALVPAILKATRDEAIDALLARLTAALTPLAPKIAALKVHLIGHSHIDMNWLWTWPDTVEVIKRDFRSVVKLMDEFPELKFSHSQPATYEVIRKEEPALFTRVQQLVEAGRWEPITMTWVEGDVNMASGEAHARQFLQGVHYTRDMFHVSPTTMHEPDTFGHAGNLPQLAASAGATRYYHHRANEGQFDQWPAYWWEGQDGTRILGISTPSYNGEITAGDVANAALHGLRHGLKVSMHFHGIGDHGGGPSRQNLQTLRRLAKNPLLPQARCSSTAAYTKDVLESGVALPVHRGESNTIFEGCYTTHADTKRYNRHGENLLCTADTLSALAGDNHNTELTAAWRKVLFNQFHDIFDGSAIHESYIDNAADFAAVKRTAQKVINAALERLQGAVASGRVAVTNPLGIDRDDWVCVPGVRGKGTAWLVGSNGHVTPGQYSAEGLGFVAHVAAFDTVSYEVRAKAPVGATLAPAARAALAGASDGSPATAADAPFICIETALYRAVLRRNCGVLVSFIDKRVNRQLVGYGGRRGSDYNDTGRPDMALNVFQVLDEALHGMTAWQYQEVQREQSLINGATSRIVESGPVRVVVLVEHKIRASTIRQRISFYAELPRVDFDTTVDWHEPGNATVGIPDLKVAFTANLDECHAWFEAPFAAVRRPSNGLEVPALRWADVGGGAYGFALLNDCKYGHDALGDRLRITLLRTAYDPDTNSDPGRHEIRYAFLPHPGTWANAGVVDAAAGFNQPLLARLIKGRRPVRRGAGPAIRPQLAGASSVAIACLKEADDGHGVIVRLYESAGRTGQIDLSGFPAGAVVTETNIVEDDKTSLPTSDGHVSLSFRPWQVRTLRIAAR